MHKMGVSENGTPLEKNSSYRPFTHFLIHWRRKTYMRTCASWWPETENTAKFGTAWHLGIESWGYINEILGNHFNLAVGQTVSEKLLSGWRVAAPSFTATILVVSACDFSQVTLAHNHKMHRGRPLGKAKESGLRFQGLMLFLTQPFRSKVATSRMKL